MERKHHYEIYFVVYFKSEHFIFRGDIFKFKFYIFKTVETMWEIILYPVMGLIFQFDLNTSHVVKNYKKLPDITMSGFVQKQEFISLAESQ